MSKTYKPEATMTKVARASSKAVKFSEERRRARKMAKATLGRLCRSNASPAMAY